MGRSRAGRHVDRARARRRRRAIAGAGGLVTLALACLMSAGHARAEGTGQPRYRFDMWAPTLRTGPGLAAHLAPSQSPGFLYVAHVGAQVHFVGAPLDPILFVEPFVGYAFAGRDPGALHTFAVGAGFGLGSRTIRGLVRPRLLAGAAAGQRAIGLRTGLALEGWMGAIGLEASHQLVDIGGQLTHGMGLLITTDLVAVALVAVRRWWQG